MAKQEYLKMKDLKIVFMGTPEFSVTILNGLIKAGANISCVITAADKPAGRGRKISESAVKKYAVENQLDILQPINLKDPQFLEQLKEYNADLFVVVAFRMLPEVVWEMPPKGTINLHASLLPQYRGAAPINWAIINGEEKTGVTTFFIEKEIDTGKIIQSKKVSITENMTAGELHDILSTLGVTAINETVESIASGSVNSIDQDQNNLTSLKKAPKIFKSDSEIDWSMKSERVHNLIRGMNPYPGAWCKVKFKGKILNCKLFNSRLTDIPVLDKNMVKDDNVLFLFPCSNKYISIEEIQIEGKRRICFKDFNAGNSINDLVLL